MTSAAFSAFVCLPTVIDAPGKYVTRCGEVVDVSRASSMHYFACAGTYSNGIIECWHRSGRLYFGQECPNDIVRRAPSEMPLDQMWAYTNPINSVSSMRSGFECGSIDAPDFIARGCTVENITEDRFMDVNGRQVKCSEAGRHVIGGIAARG